MLVFFESVVAVVVLILVVRYLRRGMRATERNGSQGKATGHFIERRSGRDRRLLNDRRDDYYNRTGRSGRRSGRDRRRQPLQREYLRDSR